MAQHRDRPPNPKPSTKPDDDAPATAPIKKSSSHSDLAQAIRREIDRAIG